MCATPIQAQGFGSILKKAKKVLTPSSEPAKTEATQAKPAASNAAEEPIATGGTLINPLKDKVDVQLVGAYGKSTSENYGEVSLVLKVKMIANKNEISIGGNSNWPVMLIDEEGNAIKKGILNERIRYSWLGITDGALDNGTENLSSIRSRVAPYVIPIPTDRVMSSNGVLSNDGYAIRNK